MHDHRSGQPHNVSLTRKPWRRWQQTATASQKRIRILIRRTLGRETILMAALAYRRRALPLRWQVRQRRRRGLACFRRSPGRSPKDYGAEVVVVGDGAFHSTDLMRYG